MLFRANLSVGIKHMKGGVYPSVYLTGQPEEGTKLDKREKAEAWTVQTDAVGSQHGTKNIIEKSR